MHPYMTQALAAERVRDMQEQAAQARQARQARRARRGTAALVADLPVAASPQARIPEPRPAADAGRHLVGAGRS